jgi:cation diffusion facilitator family transporter
MSAPSRSLLPLIAAFSGNLAIAILKGVAAFFTGSGAMLAEAVHSLADTSNQVLLYVGLRRARREPDRLHPFGYGQEAYFWAFLVAMGIFAGGSVFSIYEGVHRLQHPVEASGSRLWGYGVLIGAVFFEGGAFMVALRSFRRTMGNAGPVKAIREARDPVIFTVLLEDSGALVGLVVALLGLGLVDLTGIAAFDSIASIIIGLILAFIAFFLGREVHSLLLGESVHPQLRSRIVEALESAPEVQRLVELRTLQMGPQSVLVMVDASVDSSVHAGDVAAAVEAVEQRLHELDATIKRVYVHPEPSGKSG